jgi:hypothetical protein
MVTLEPGARQIKLYDNKYLMFENLNLSRKTVACPIKSKPWKISGVCRDFLIEGKILRR